MKGQAEENNLVKEIKEGQLREYETIDTHEGNFKNKQDCMNSFMYISYLVAQLIKKNLPTMQEVEETWVGYLSREDSLEKEMAIFLPGKFHGQRSLAGYSPCSCKESDTTEHTCLTHLTPQ